MMVKLLYASVAYLTMMWFWFDVEHALPALFKIYNLFLYAFYLILDLFGLLVSFLKYHQFIRWITIRYNKTKCQFENGKCCVQYNKWNAEGKDSNLFWIIIYELNIWRIVIQYVKIWCTDGFWVKEFIFGRDGKCERAFFQEWKTAHTMIN